MKWDPWKCKAQRFTHSRKAGAFNSGRSCSDVIQGREIDLVKRCNRCVESGEFKAVVSGSATPLESIVRDFRSSLGQRNRPYTFIGYYLQWQ